MAVPKTTMDENHLVARPKNQVWFSREILSVEAITVAHSMYKSSDEEFWLRVLRANRLHDPPLGLGAAGPLRHG